VAKLTFLDFFGQDFNFTGGGGGNANDVHAAVNEALHGGNGRVQSVEGVVTPGGGRDSNMAQTLHKAKHGSCKSNMHSKDEK